ncbi:hypothetical protein PCANC_14841 [Puccinia coronata f. sp. avenae]|uniref:1,3-beta-glucanosyltransferase n=1 Tax=Puccinia coronata f. sp. avenae TaxID=200324 RepID=A0A2N5UI43_9BASI|nr:hypothetical protein PCANC_28782 [Puccinia coronata f. sp. avenae]PLW37424.1 hypothetical protein PCANC_14841 [Puccinia coronata f. sp. avenae]
MHSRSWALSCAFLLTLVKLAFSSVDTPRITRVGRYLYDENGKRFYIKGVAFQKNGNDQYGNRGESAQAVNTIEKLDPLADFNACKIAIKDFRRLKINTVRVYSYDIEKNHTACMNALERVGIYVIADINPRSANRASQTWDVDLLREYISRIDSLREFPNLLAFNIGNEMIKNSENLEAGPYIKARARDMKTYLKSVNSTALVSYASADGKRFPADLARFLSCNSGGPSAELDLFGVNNYRWCGFSDFQSAYEELTLEFQGSTVAAYFSEFGCLSPGNPRVWTEVPILFSTLMSDLWSGGVAYSYYPTPLGYGLVDYSTKAEGRALRTKDFDNLAQWYRQVKPPNQPKLKSLVAPKQKCTSTNSNSFAITSVLPPQPNAEACNCADRAAFTCQVRKDASPLVIAELLEDICKDLGVAPGSGEGCAAISSASSKASYGRLSACSPTTRLNYAMTRHFINSGLDPKACSFSGNATIQKQSKAKSFVEVARETEKCFEINADKAIPNQPTGVGRNTPAQINSSAYRESISGARTQSRAKTSGSSLRKNSKKLNIMIKLWPLYVVVINLKLFKQFL